MGHGARNNSSGSHPAQEARRRFIIARWQSRPRKRQPPGKLGQAGSALTLPGAEPLCFLRPYSSAATEQNRSTPPSSSYCNNPGQAQLEVGKWVFCQPLIRSQPSRAGPRSHHRAASARERGRLVGLWLSAPKAALAPLLSANGSEVLKPDLAPSFPWASGISSVVCSDRWLGEGERRALRHSRALTPGSPGSPCTEDAAAKRQAEMMDGTRRLQWS